MNIQINTYFKRRSEKCRWNVIQTLK